MDRTTHMASALANLKTATELSNAGQLDQAGEIFGGAIVQAVSAADPEHEKQPPDRFGNAHAAPNIRPEYNAATQRICNAIGKYSYPGAPGQSDYDIALRTGQIGLHNHYYHLNLNQESLTAHVSTINHLAHQITEHAIIVLSPLSPPISRGTPVNNTPSIV